jgi:hypothetical protein
MALMVYGTQGHGGKQLMKKSEVENLVALSLYGNAPTFNLENYGK